VVDLVPDGDGRRGPGLHRPADRRCPHGRRRARGGAAGAPRGRRRRGGGARHGAGGRPASGAPGALGAPLGGGHVSRRGALLRAGPPALHSLRGVGDLAGGARVQRRPAAGPPAARGDRHRAVVGAPSSRSPGRALDSGDGGGVARRSRGVPLHRHPVVAARPAHDARRGHRPRRGTRDGGRRRGDHGMGTRPSARARDPICRTPWSFDRHAEHAASPRSGTCAPAAASVAAPP
jgi:hypothetical protein